MTILLNRLPATRISIFRQLFNIDHMKVTDFHRTITSRYSTKQTPNIYLEDNYKVKEAGGMTEEEGAGGRNPGVAEEYVLAGVPDSEVGYGAPGGPYHTSDPFEAPHKTGKPTIGEFSSTSPDYAHPLLTKKAAKVDDGEGSSSTLRYRDAPGQMLKGSDGGIRLSAGVQATENTLGERNPQPRTKFSEDTAGEMKKK